MRAPAIATIGALVIACGHSTSVPSDAGADASPRDNDSAVETCLADTEFEWPVPIEPVTITSSPAWKNQIALADDAFFNTSPTEGIRWVKFAVLLSDPTKVYFQNSQQFPFHYDFASQHLDPFKGMSRQDFEQVSLHATNQEVILGAVLSPTLFDGDYGVQLVGLDPYHPEMAKRILNVVSESVVADGAKTMVYMPTTEQQEVVSRCSAWFAEHNITVDALTRWLEGNQCYAQGWALGRVVSVPGDEIEAAYLSGALTPSDILLTDRLPAEIPLVAGILTEHPVTPNSHVVILAQSFGVPLAYLSDLEERQRARDLIGREIVLRADPAFSGDSCWVRLIDLEGQLTDQQRSDLRTLAAPKPLSLQAKASFGNISAEVATLSETHIRYFGGKASHFELLTSAIADNAPHAIALSFDLWDQFMSQQMATGNTLARDIAAMLAGFSFPPDFAALDAALADVRALIKTEARFSESQRNAIQSALSGFDASRRLRFRSSTNVEDTDQFVGAGLYDSFSGCLADDLDDDDSGPSACDSSRAKERGVFRAIRKVYASFYKRNAFVERLRHGVDESDVAMALLVHHSFPDETELANGVATAHIRPSSAYMQLVTQAGALSVANPINGATPERVDVDVFSFGAYPTLRQGSSEVPLGQTVLAMPDEYVALSGLMSDVASLYRSRHSGLNNYTLDFEYKKITDQGLVIKQVRRLPQPSLTATQPVYLVNEPVRRCIFQGEFGDVFANHRLKSQWALTTVNGALSVERLQTTLLASSSVQYWQNTELKTQAGVPSQWPSASHTYVDDKTHDVFTTGAGAQQRTWDLRITMPPEVRATQSPVRSMADYHASLEVTHAAPVVAIDHTGVITRNTDAVNLGPCPSDLELTALTPRVERTFTFGDITIETTFYWPEPPVLGVGYTAPLYKWEQTRITGLTTDPIVLRSDYSQTYRPHHHNVDESFIFDPWLEPNIPQHILDELTAKNVRYLVIEYRDQLWIRNLSGGLIPYVD